ncbi:DUF4097 family beta strand repeat-containing protein [Meiothermus sp.]|uniref:DUF4097 family beta strand repeat-containing protein n=1 Tax=Meiothermus sp. TaxID=1955249 RepID=UPI00307F5858
MNERSRILKLVEDGKITPDEATMLLQALAEVEAPARGFGFVPPEPLDSREGGSRRLERLSEAARQLGARAEEMGRRVAEELDPVVGVGEPVTVSYPSHLRWFKVRQMSGDLEVVLEPSRTEPLVEGEVQLRGRRRGPLKMRGEIVEKVLEKLYGEAPGDVDLIATDDVTVRLPQGWGLACEVFSGDLKVEGIPFVRGRVTSGDVSLQSVGGVDLQVVSGDLDAELRLTEGQHNLELLDGDGNITFLDSSVRVEGRLLHGDFSAQGQFEKHKRKVSGTVGEGTAHLRVVIHNGDLTLEDQSHYQEEEV